MVVVTSIPSLRAGSLGSTPVPTCATEVWADVDIEEATGGQFSLPWVVRFPEATFWADDFTTTSFSIEAFATDFFLAPATDLGGIRNYVEVSDEGRIGENDDAPHAQLYTSSTS